MSTTQLFAKMKKIGDSDTNNKKTQSGYRKGIWHGKSAMLIMKSRKRQITEGTELPNQERMRTLGVKENYKVDTIKQVVMK